MNKTIQEVSPLLCTGCGACYNKCPVGAITMQEDAEGFSIPVLDQGLCIHCGLCAEHCHILNKEYIKQYVAAEPECYAVMASDEIRKKSSSGGMFTILAEYVLAKDGVVCGAAYSDDYRSVHHIIVDNKEDLGLLRGSKYVQSDTGKTYAAVEAYIKSGRWVLYTGTPCQIAGLRSYLKKEYDNLLLVDIVCHGTPSPKAYRLYIDEKASGKQLVCSDFRDKAFWGWGTATSFFFDDGSVYRGDCYQDEYWRAFLGGLSTRKCCGTCEFASFNRIGDFTIGDFWGVAELNKNCDDGGGTSLLFANSPRAKSLVPAMKSSCRMFSAMDPEKTRELAKKRNGQLIKCKSEHEAHSRFFELLNSKSFTTAFDYAVNSKYDVGVTGWWYNENYGGTMTYYALNRVLQKMGKSVLMIAKCSSDPSFTPKYTSIPYRFALKHYDISKTFTPGTIGSLADKCESFISGSDQLFNPTLWQYSGPQYFLSFAKPNNRIISYASSFGNSFVDIGTLKYRMGYWLRRFTALSVRESYAVDIARDVFGLEAKKVMDPVFLCDMEDYDRLAQQSGLKKESDYLVSFFLDPDEKKRDSILYLSKKLGLSYINLLDASNYKKNAEILCLDNTKMNADIEEWVFYYKNADFVITDSFHGTCFAIIFRKKFISVANHKRGANRFISILTDAGLLSRMVNDLSEIENRPELFEEIDYDAVYARLTPLIRDSWNWLKTALEAPVSSDLSGSVCSDYEIDRLTAETERLKEKMTLMEADLNKQKKLLAEVPRRRHYLKRFVRLVKNKGLVYAFKRGVQKIAKRLK